MPDPDHEPLADTRREYTRTGLTEADLAADPFDQFDRWYAEAWAAGIVEANAFTLATATPDGLPSARTVLLKGLDRRGFVFYTNYESAKANDLDANPRAAILFFWRALERQVRIGGEVARVAAEESAAYFRSRPLGSRLGAIVSPQSRPIPDRAWLEARYAELAVRYPEPDADPPLPAHWGGYRLLPTWFEFWQGRQNRLHDRLRYVADGQAGWRVTRLAP
jgi:pyridoxamine 5'-phosphate oxidase